LEPHNKLWLDEKYQYAMTIKSSIYHIIFSSYYFSIHSRSSYTKI